METEDWEVVLNGQNLKAFYCFPDLFCLSEYFILKSHEVSNLPLNDPLNKNLKIKSNDV